MAYITPSEFLKRYDVRVVGDLVSDTGARVDATSLLSNTNLMAALDDGAAMIDSAALVSQRYTTDDLAALTGVDQAILFRLNADLAYVFLVQRRGLDTSKLPQYDAAMKMLELIRDGERVFNVAETLAAGVPSAEFPSIVTLCRLNLLRDFAYRAFPVRREQSTH